MKPEIIHLWQFLGQTHPELLKDEAFENAKKAGITSLQSYFYWAEIEKEEGKIDWSSYDVLVEKIKKHNLKWVPFCILGPGYITPKWFQKSPESVFYKCLEHEKECANQSIWNPNLPKYVERFLASAASHYRDKDIFESIILGIAGNWGEAIYPAGGYWFGNFHTHDGFWSADRYAKESFIKFSLRKYQTLANLNRAWGTDFQEAKLIEFPAVKESKKQLFFNKAVSVLGKNPVFIKKLFKLVLAKTTKKSFLSVSGPSSQPRTSSKSEGKKRWLDFVNWYLGSMTDWAEFWVKTARKYFPETKIYLVTGGNSNPILGADFASQTKVSAKYGAGIRITNLTNDYAQSFVLTRLVSTAARFYQTYFTTEEEAVLQTPEGVTMRMFDVMSSGADGFFCRNIVSIGKICPFVTPDKLAIGQSTPGAENLKKYLPLFDSQKPETETAVFYPNTSLALDLSLVASLYNKCAQLRDVLDFDLVDESLIKDGALKKYKYLLVVEGEIPAEVKEKVEEWKNQGGTLTSDPKAAPNNIDNEADGVYATKFANKVIYYNSTNKKIKKNIPFLQKSVELDPNSIISFPL